MSANQFKSPVVRWIDHRLPVFSMLHHTAHDYPTPKNLNYMWNFGSLAGLSLAIMIVTGIVLAMSYTAHVDYAFDSVERIMRDVNHGWMIRYIHMNTASFFFIVVYLHMFRGLYYGSYKAPRELLWMLGVVIFLLMMATAFMGYVLPWGQMSFWGATVITNLFSAIPYVGESIVTLLWGGFSVDNATLNRFFSLHYLMPFIIAGVVVLHIVALHRFGSNNPIGIDTKGPQDTISFHPYYTIKDVFDDPQIQHREMEISMPHPLSGKGDVSLIGSPVKMSATPVSYRHAPPTLGQHTNEILAEMLGMDEEEYKELAQKGVV